MASIAGTAQLSSLSVNISEPPAAGVRPARKSKLYAAVGIVSAGLVAVLAVGLGRSATANTAPTSGAAAAPPPTVASALSGPVVVATAEPAPQAGVSAAANTNAAPAITVVPAALPPRNTRTTPVTVTQPAVKPVPAPAAKPQSGTTPKPKPTKPDEVDRGF